MVQVRDEDRRHPCGNTRLWSRGLAAYEIISATPTGRPKAHFESHTTVVFTGDSNTPSGGYLAGTGIAQVLPLGTAPLHADGRQISFSTGRARSFRFTLSPIAGSATGQGTRPLIFAP